MMFLPKWFAAVFKRSRDVVPVSAPFEPKPMRRSSGSQSRGRRRAQKAVSLKSVFRAPRLISGGFSGNSHQRRIQRRRNERRIRLAAA